MDQYIPRISKATLDSAYQSIIEEGGECNSFPIIQKQNPNIMTLVKDVMQSDLFNDDFREGFCKGINAVYKLINSQMQSNDMQESMV